VRVVIDTNVLISATFWTGKPKQLLNKVRQGEIRFLTSEILLNELRDVLVREDKPFKLSRREAEKIVTEIRSYAEIIEIKHKLAICKDEIDNCVLECAEDGKGSCVISGDQHLLDLKSFRGVRIMTVAEFLHNLKGASATTGG
jgi:putative PIN family toxin of toxin-antitoxin system